MSAEREIEEMIRALEAERKRKGVPMKELARRCGVSTPTFYRWINGQGGCTLDSFLLAARALGLVIAVKGDAGITVINKKGGKRACPG